MLQSKFHSYQLIAEEPKTGVMFSVPSSGHMFCWVCHLLLVSLWYHHLSPAFKISLPQSCLLRWLSLLLQAGLPRISHPTGSFLAPLLDFSLPPAWGHSAFDFAQYSTGKRMFLGQESAGFKITLTKTERQEDKLSTCNFIIHATSSIPGCSPCRKGVLKSSLPFVASYFSSCRDCALPVFSTIWVERRSYFWLNNLSNSYFQKLILVQRSEYFHEKTPPYIAKYETSAQPQHFK